MTQKAIRKKLRDLQRWAAMGLGLLVLALAFHGQAFAQPPSPLDPQSNNAGEVADLFYLILWIAIAVFVLVEGLLIFAVVRYRRREDDEVPEQVHGNATLEIMWTVVPSLIMALLFYLTLDTLQAQRNIPEDALEIKVVGRQWFWEFTYEERITTTDELWIPVGRPVKFTVTSADVIHSFWVPQLGGKIDAIPGHDNITWFAADEAGVYAGQCAEFCGLEHYAMLFDVHAVSQDEFDTWLAEQRAAAEAAGDIIGTEVTDIPALAETLPEGNSTSGQELFGSLGCQACHSLDTTKLVGPGLEGVGERAANRKSDYSAEAYIAESLIHPSDFLVEGFSAPSPMPSFGERLTSQDLADLIAFLLEQ